MKISLALGRGGRLDVQAAWGCLMTNLAMPGFGSLLAGRVSGYFQAVLCVAGLLVTSVFGVRFAFWFFRNWARLSDPEADPVTTLSDLWQAVRWALLGITLFAVAWLWALVTGWQVVRAAKQSEKTATPPPLA